MSLVDRIEGVGPKKTLLDRLDNNNNKRDRDTQDPSSNKRIRNSTGDENQSVRNTSTSTSSARDDDANDKIVVVQPSTTAAAATTTPTTITNSFDNLSSTLNNIINKNLEIKNLEASLLQLYEQKHAIKSTFGQNHSSASYQRDMNALDLQINRLQLSIKMANKASTNLASDLFDNLFHRDQITSGGDGDSSGGSNITTNTPTTTSNSSIAHVDNDKFNAFVNITNQRFEQLVSTSKSTSSDNNDLRESLNSLKDGFRTTRDDIYDKLNKDLDSLENHSSTQLRGLDDNVVKPLQDRVETLFGKMRDTSNNHVVQTKKQFESIREDIRRLEEQHKEESKKNEETIAAQNERIELIEAHNKELQGHSLKANLTASKNAKAFKSLQEQINALKQQITQPSQTPPTFTPSTQSTPAQSITVSRSVTPAPPANANRGKAPKGRQSVPPRPQQPQQNQPIKARLSGSFNAPNGAARPPQAHQQQQQQQQPSMLQRMQPPIHNPNDAHGRPLPPHMQR